MEPNIREAVECLKLLVQRKFFADKKEELSIFLCGAAFTGNHNIDDDNNVIRVYNSEFPNIVLVRDLSPIDWDVLEFLNSDTLLSTEQADLMDALIIGSEYLISRCRNRKDIKEMRVIFVSNLAGYADKTKIASLSETITSNGINVSLIGHCFNSDNGHQSYDAVSEGGSLADDFAANQNFKVSACVDVVNDLWSKIDGESFTFDEALPALAYFETRTIAQRGWKADLQIGDSLSLPTEGFCQVKEAHHPPLKLVYAADPSTPIQLVTTYHAQDGQTTELKPSQVVRGYRYGSTILPFSNEDLLAVKPNSEKCLMVVGFTDAINVPPSLFVGDSVLVFTPSTNLEDSDPKATSLNALAQALFELNMVAIVRRVYNRVSAPRLGVMTPEINENQITLVYTDIAFADDVRDFTFPTLPVKTKCNPDHPEPSGSRRERYPSDSELISMNSLVDAMLLDQSISSAADNDPDFEAGGSEDDGRTKPRGTFQPERLPNPWIQRLFSCFRQRGLDSTPLMVPSTSHRPAISLPVPECFPGLESLLSRICSQDDAELADARRRLVDALPSLSPAQNEEDDRSGLSAAKRRRLIAAELFGTNTNYSLSDPMQSTSSAQNISDTTANHCGHMEKTSSTALPDPVEEFRAYISQNHISLACERLRRHIITLVTDPYLGSFLRPRAETYLKVFRDSAVELANRTNPDVALAVEYNAFLSSWAADLESCGLLSCATEQSANTDDSRLSFWRSALSQGLGPISDTEAAGVCANTTSAVLFRPPQSVERSDVVVDDTSLDDGDVAKLLEEIE